MVGQPTMTGYPDAAASMAKRSASIFERGGGPHVIRQGHRRRRNHRGRGTEQDRFRRAVQEAPYAAFAVSMTISVPPKLTV
jgi:hypothetical protein